MKLQIPKKDQKPPQNWLHWKDRFLQNKNKTPKNKQKE